jgi:hypothetical protein
MDRESSRWASIRPGTEGVDSSSLSIRFTSEEIERLAELNGLHIPAEDFAPLAELLTAHCAFVEPLLRRDLSEMSPALVFDPRWRDRP